MSGKSALLAGATGLVGGYVLRRLLAHPSYARVDILVRRELPIRDPKLTQRIVDFSRLDAGARLATIGSTKEAQRHREDPKTGESAKSRSASER